MIRRFPFILALGLLLCPLAVRGQGVRYDNVAQTNISGVVRVIPNAPITVCTSAGAGIPCSPTTPIFSDAALSVPITQPGFTADANGNFGFYIAPTASFKYSIGSSALAPGGALYAVTPQCPLAGACTFTGAIIHSGTETFGAGIRYTATANCSASGIQADINALGAEGSLHSEGCTAPFVLTTSITLSNPIDFWLPCTSIYGNANVQPWVVQSNGVHMHACDAGAVGSVIDQSSFGNGSPGTQFVACTGNGTPVVGCTAAMSNTNDMVTVLSTSHASQSVARMSNFSLDNVFIEMNGVGRRAIYTSSCWHCRLDKIGVDKANGDGAFYIEADAPGDTTFAASYRVELYDLSCGIASGNTTTHCFYFDTSNGEISELKAAGLRAGGVGNSTGSGSDLFYVNTGTGSLNDSFDESEFTDIHAQNPSSGAYGFKLQCRGNFFAATGGRCFDNTFRGFQMERLFGQGASGTAIGCVNGAGIADGTGCAFFSFINVIPFNFTTLLDEANLGGHLAVVNRNISDSGESATYDFLGKLLTNNAGAVDVPYFKIAPSSLSANAASQNFFGLNIDFSGATSSGGSNPNIVAAIRCNSVPAFAPAGVTPCLYDVNGTTSTPTIQGNTGFWNGYHRFTESVAPGGISGFLFNWDDSTTHWPMANITNGGSVKYLVTGSQANNPIQTKRITTGSINASTRADVTVTWPNTFADTNYTPTCFVTETTVVAGTQSLVAERIHTVNNGSIIVSVFNGTAGALTGTLNCNAIHD